MHQIESKESMVSWSCRVGERLPLFIVPRKYFFLYL